MYHNVFFFMKIFFAFMVLSMGYSISLRAQDDADVQWFENLFVVPGNMSLDEEVRALEIKRLKAREIQDKKLESKIMIELGVLHLTRINDYEQALGWLMRSLRINDSLNFHHERILTYLAMARVFEEVGNYAKSKEFLNEAESINARDNDLIMKSLIMNESGRVKASHGEMDLAFEDYNQVLDLSRKLELPSREGDAFFHLGQLLTKEKKYNDALRFHKDGLAIRRKLKDKSGEAMSLNDIGALYLLMNNYERALANHVAALEIRKKLDDDAGLAQSYNNVGELYIKKKDFKRAILNLDLALESGRAAQDQEQILKAHELLSQCYKELKDYKKALEAKESSVGIMDMIQREKNERKLLETQNRYIVEKKESEIDHLQLERAQREKVIEDQRQLRNLLFLFIGFGLIIGALLLYLYFLKRRSNQKLLEINATKDKLFSIIGHDLKSPLNSLSAFSSLLINHAESLTKEEIKMLSQDLDKSLKNLFNLLENLLEWGRSQSGNIDFKPEPFDLSEVLKENMELLRGAADTKRISLVNNNNSVWVVNAHRNSINTVVRNLISNAIKFTPEGGTIALKTEPIGNFIRLSVTDTGVGMSHEVMQKLFTIGNKHSTLGTAQEKGTGLGLVLCHDFVEKNGGKIGVESVQGKGSTFYFTVPANK
jgi:signal transduction histidine kinase/tetratricopeptide (TPR) repeat protein